MAEESNEPPAVPKAPQVDTPAVGGPVPPFEAATASGKAVIPTNPDKPKSPGRTRSRQSRPNLKTGSPEKINEPPAVPKAQQVDTPAVVGLAPPSEAAATSGEAVVPTNPDKPKSPGRTRSRQSRLAKILAIVVALVGGVGSGLGAALYTDLKTIVGAWFAEKPDFLYVREIVPGCKKDETPDFSKQDVYLYSLAVSKVGTTWAGTISDIGKSSPKYKVTGYKNGNYLSLSWVSAKGNAGVGQHFLHRESNGGPEYYEGFAVGRDCAGRTEQTVKCPVTLADVDDLDAIKKRPFMQQPCVPDDSENVKAGTGGSSR
jgi:hypothetical protein